MTTKTINIVDVIMRVVTVGSGTKFHFPPILDGSWRPPNDAFQGNQGEPSVGYYSGTSQDVVPAPLCGGRQGAFIAWTALDGYWTREQITKNVDHWLKTGFCKNCVKKYEQFTGRAINMNPPKRFTDKDRQPVLFVDPRSPNQPSRLPGPNPTMSSPLQPMVVLAQQAQQAPPVAITRAEAIDLASKVKQYVLENRCSIDEGIEHVATAQSVAAGLVSRAFYKYTSPVLVTALTFGDE